MNGKWPDVKLVGGWGWQLVAGCRGPLSCRAPCGHRFCRVEWAHPVPIIELTVIVIPGNAFMGKPGRVKSGGPPEEMICEIGWWTDGAMHLYGRRNCLN